MALMVTAKTQLPCCRPGPGAECLRCFLIVSVANPTTPCILCPEAVLFCFAYFELFRQNYQEERITRSRLWTVFCFPNGHSGSHWVLPWKPTQDPHFCYLESVHSRKKHPEFGLRKYTPDHSPTRCSSLTLLLWGVFMSWLERGL